MLSTYIDISYQICINDITHLDLGWWTSPKECRNLGDLLRIRCGELGQQVRPGAKRIEVILIFHGKITIFHGKIIIFHGAIQNFPWKNQHLSWTNPNFPLKNHQFPRSRRSFSASRTFQDPQEAAMSLGSEALSRWQDGSVEVLGMRKFSEFG